MIGSVTICCVHYSITSIHVSRWLQVLSSVVYYSIPCISNIYVNIPASIITVLYYSITWVHWYMWLKMLSLVVYYSITCIPVYMWLKVLLYSSITCIHVTATIITCCVLFNHLCRMCSRCSCWLATMCCGLCSQVCTPEPDCNQHTQHLALFTSYLLVWALSWLNSENCILSCAGLLGARQA